MKRIQILSLMLAVDFSLLMIAAAPAFAGSPFYLTVERSFSHTEKPQVRLDYTSTDKPMLVRILRPENLERFLDGQFQISRSYEQPMAELNPGHFFITGLNKMESPLKTTRNMLDPKFRENFKDTSLSKSIQDTTPGQIALPPEDIIQGPPAGFAVVRDMFIDLKYLGTAVNDLGWWFGEKAWSENRYKIRKIELDPLPDGVYLIQAVQGKTEAQCLMQVSSLSVQVKQSTEQLVVRVIDRQLNPIAGAGVSYRDGRGKWVSLNKKTDPAGEIAFLSPEGALDGKLVVKVQTPDGRQALVDTDFLPTVSNDDSVFIITDRPIFKPGETFFYKGMIRAFEKDGLKIPRFGDTQAKVSLIPFNGPATDLQADVPLTGFGSFSGSFSLDAGQAPGLYKLIAEIDAKPYGGEFRVRDYVKPTFYLELIDRSPTVTSGGRFFVKFRAKRYSGGVPYNLKYEVFLYRKKFETPQWVVESGGGLNAGTDYQGEIKSASALTEPKRIYSSVEARLADGKLSPTNTWESAAVMDGSGEAFYEFDLPKIDAPAEQEWIYTVMVRAIDASGSQALLTENIYITLSEAQPSVQFSKTVARIGEKGLSVFLRSTYPDGKPAPGAGGVLNIGLEQVGAKPGEFVKLPFTTDDKGQCRLPLPELTRRGRLRAVAVLETLDGKPMTRPCSSLPALLIAGDMQGEAVLDNRELELYTEKTILSPGEKAQVLALLPINWGKSESGIIWETISGSRIHDTRSTPFKGRSRWFEVEARPEYNTGFYHTVGVPLSGGKYAEQTLGFRIIPWTKRLNISIMPEREETEPLKPFRIDFLVKNADGEPAPDTELAVTIVDRAVYAVQPEFRPGVFDFFYPLPRLNLATFYSDELQGYGYADLLKKPNFKLGALKSQSKITKKSMRDTAGWFPHVITDPQGRASVTVDLPANVTEWLITAVAADKDGRVGETKGRFRTLTDISVDVLAPQFLRRDEAAEIKVASVNHLAQSLSVTSRMELAGEALVTSGVLEAAFTLEKQGEKLLPLVIEAKGESGAATLNVSLETQEKIHVGGPEAYDIPLKPSAMKQIFSGEQKGDTLVTQLPDIARITDVKVQVNSGLLGAALNAASILVSYPYGCTEQLVHSTIPNLVLMELVRRAGIARDQLGPLAEPLEKAEKNAGLGIRKIRQNQKGNGGFSLWPSDSDASPAITATTLYALKFAKELKIEGAEGAFERGIGWLSEQVKDDDQNQIENGAARNGYNLSRMAEIGLYSQPWKQQIAYVEALRREESSSLMHLVYGLKIIAAYKNQSWNRFNEHFKDMNVKVALIDKLKKAIDQLDKAAEGKTAGDAQLFNALGFGFGFPYIASSAMGVLDDLGALQPELETRMKRLLLSHMKNGYWISTFDSAQVIFNSRGILSREAAAFAREKETKARKILVRKKDGTQMGELTRIPSGFIGRFEAPGAPDLLSLIRLDGLESTEFASAAIAADVPYRAVAPKSNGVTIQRRFLRVTATGNEPVDPARPLQKGDVVIIEVSLSREPIRNARSVQSRFLVVEDGIPSLGQAIDDDRTYLADAGVQADDNDYWASVKQTQRYPERTVRIASVLPTGEMKLYQVWRVAFAGKATIPPAQAFDMYDESIRGNTGAQGIRVE
ncbi:MAG: MG2 domain-containing protein [Deltaproteobacteria bacterium]|nr:MG2 domain-containing protein [Deltaproteobacteria bacterium]